MVPIRALNGDPEENSCCSNDAELKFSGEAEETIIVAEYMKALNLVHTGQHGNALNLFLELLETEALSKQLDNDQESRLMLVKYNCYRNIGMLYQESGKISLALDFLTQAIELDDNDVYTMCSLAELALKNGQIPVAKLYYEKCLERNPNHWPSLDGMLRLFLLSENIIESWSWASYCHNMDKNYDRAFRVLKEINYRFASSRQFMENLLNENLPLICAGDDGTKDSSNYLNSDQYVELVPHSDNRIEDVTDIESIKLSHIDWISLATLVIKLHQLLKQTGQVLTHFQLRDFCGKPKEITKHDCNVAENLLQHITQSDATPDVTDSRSSTNSDSLIDIEAKSRRRGSELKILEQWGWHKDRRSSKKKSMYDNADYIETTADLFLKRALAQYFTETFSGDISPFTGELYEQSSDSCSEEKMSDITLAERFFLNTEDDFNTLLVKLHESEIDLYLFISYYLQHVSLHWNKEMPSGLRSLYIQVYDIFTQFVNHNTWNQVNDVELIAMFRITLFYLELCHDNREENKIISNESNKLDVEKELYILQLYLSLIPSEYLIIYQTRYLWLNYAMSLYERNLGRSLNMLVQMSLLVNDRPNFEVRLPNQQFNNFYNKSTIQKMIVSLKRQISLNSVKDLYSTANYDVIVNILEDSLIHSSDIKYGDAEVLSISTQIEIMLESLWQLERYLDCMIWAEKSLKYAVDLFISTKNARSIRRNDYAKLINFVLPYIQTFIEQFVDNITSFEKMSRLVQTIHKLLNHLLDTQSDKHSCNQYVVECWRAWIIIYFVLQRQDDKNMVCRNNRGIYQSLPTIDLEEEPLLSSIMLFFVAHDLLGRRQWCSKENSCFLFMMLDIVVPILRSPMFEPYRDVINDCLEQATYCLYGYPPKKGRTRHLQDHESISTDLTWDRAVQLFDIYRPDILPEFNSYKIDSISADMEALLQHILLLMPDKYAVSPYTGPVIDFINGKTNIITNNGRDDLLCFRIRSIYYLLADYYFKSRDFSKAINYYAMDLTIEPTRFDSWAGISLSKASKCETTLNSAEEISYLPFLDETSTTIRCFEQSLKLNERDSQVWVEYGSFAYNVCSFCARHKKHAPLSMDSSSYLKTQQYHYLDIAYNSFSKVNAESNTDHKEYHDIETNEDEKWLYYYMLGKIAEKNQDRPVVYLTHYLKAAKCLYECNATYPIKINHSNPSQLSIEALEVFYRTNSAIMKYTEKQPLICKQEAGLFKKILKELAVSPFAVNRAKINDVAFKRKLAQPNDPIDIPYSATDNKNTPTLAERSIDHYDTKSNNDDKMDFLPRRSSQESNAVTNTSNTSNATSSMSSVSDSQSSGSESDSTTDDELFVTPSDRDAIFKDCIKNMEECVIRFPEHYKSVYRLAYHYMHAPGETKSLERCNQLLMGSYKATLGNQIPGLFTERRSNNFFNGIWRIPSSDIDRPGSFSAHLAKCVAILIEALKHSNDHETLLELAIQLHRRPDTDKEYLNDYDRNRLSHQAESTCIIVYHHILKNTQTRKDDNANLALMVDIFKGYRRCVKHMPQREIHFSDALVEAYRIYIQDKTKLPDSANLLDLAIKLCTYEINYRKSMEKSFGKQPEKTIKISNMCTDAPSTIVTPMQPISASFIPGLTKQRRVFPKSSTIASVPPTSKLVSVGPLAISTASLPGLTITPVNVTTSSSAEKGIATNTPNTHVSSSASGATTDLLKTFSNPETVSELSNMYFNTFTNLSHSDAILHYNKIQK